MSRAWLPPGPGPNFARDARLASDPTRFNIPNVGAKLPGWRCDDAAVEGAAVATADGDEGGGGCGSLAGLLRTFASRPPQDQEGAPPVDLELPVREFALVQLHQEALLYSSVIESRETDAELVEMAEICRICREGNTHESLITPCNCRGTVRFVHRTCLEHWLAESDSNFCEICGFRYIVERTPRFGVLKTVALWATSAYADLLLDLLAAMSLVPLAVLGTYVGMAAGNSLCIGTLSDADDDGVANLVLVVEPNMSSVAAQIVIGALLTVMAAMDIAVTAWLVMRIQQHTAHCYSWWRRHCVVRLVQPSQDQEEQPSHSKETEVAAPVCASTTSPSTVRLSDDSKPPDSIDLSSSITTLRICKRIPSKET